MDREGESEILIRECRALLSELQNVLNESINRSEIMRSKRIIEELRRENEMLYRDNVMLKSALYENK